MCALPSAHHGYKDVCFGLLTLEATNTPPSHLTLTLVRSQFTEQVFLKLLSHHIHAEVINLVSLVDTFYSGIILK